MHFSSHRVLITGATGGIGSAIAEAFYREGATLCLSGRNQARLEEMAQRYGASIWPLDLADRTAIASTIASIEKEGPVDILIHNGGVTRDRLSFQMKDQEWDEVLNVHLNAGFFLARAVAKGMMRKKWGRMIYMSSIIGKTGNPGQANYAAAKAGLIGLTKTLALELAKWNITVNAIAPGYIHTPMTEGIPSSFLEKIPLRRQGEPEEVAYATLFLADKRASYITGHTLDINGGLF